MRVCLPIWIDVHFMCGGAGRCQERVLDPLKWSCRQLWVTRWVLGTKPGCGSNKLSWLFNCLQSLTHLLNCWVWLVSAINLYPSEGVWAVGEKVNSAELITNSLSVLNYHYMDLHTSFSNLEYKCNCFSVKIMPFGDQFIRALVRNGGITWKCRLTVIRYF